MNEENKETVPALLPQTPGMPGVPSPAKIVVEERMGETIETPSGHKIAGDLPRRCQENPALAQMIRAGNPHVDFGDLLGPVPGKDVSVEGTGTTPASPGIGDAANDPLAAFRIEAALKVQATATAMDGMEEVGTILARDLVRAGQLPVGHAQAFGFFTLFRDSPASFKVLAPSTIAPIKT